MLTSKKSLLSAADDRTTFEEELDGGYRMLYQISNERANEVQNEAFSWRAILRNLKLPNEAYFVVISQRDGTILVHPDAKKIGKSYEALGFASKEEFLDAYEKPDQSGMFLIFEDVIHVGDFVRVGNNSGIVKSIGVRMTKLRSYDTVISINNAELKAMQNMSDGISYVRSSLLIDSGEDEKHVKEIIRQELPEINDRLRETGFTATNVSFNGVTSSDEKGMKYEFGVFGVTYETPRVKRLLKEGLYAMCERNEIRVSGPAPKSTPPRKEC